MTLMLITWCGFLAHFGGPDVGYVNQLQGARVDFDDDHDVDLRDLAVYQNRFGCHGRARGSRMCCILNVCDLRCEGLPFNLTCTPLGGTQ